MEPEKEMASEIDCLYKYGRLSEYSEELFSSAKIFFAAPSQLNDPFECSPVFTFEATKKQRIEAATQMLVRHPDFPTPQAATKEAHRLWDNGRLGDPALWKKVARDLMADAKGVGLYCLSQERASILMWAHYADNHQGYCLEFAADDRTPVFGAAQRVSYSGEYPTVNLFRTPTEGQIDTIFLRKYKGWEYEQEWRIINHQTGPGLRSYPLPLLKGIIFGLRMTEENRTRIKEWVGRRGHPVQFYQARQHERAFMLEIDIVSPDGN
jgi:hypothetical protein